MTRLCSIATIFCQLFVPSTQVDLDLLAQAWTIPTGGSNGQPYNHVVVDGVDFPGERTWDDRWILIKEATNYQNKKVLELGCNVALVSTYLLKYQNAALCTGVDRPDDLLAFHGMPDLIKAAKTIHRAFNVSPHILQIDMNHADYENTLGYDYDIVFCMSFLKWADDKERLLEYLSHFQEIIFEGHEEDSNEIDRFQKKGFQYRILGKTQVGVSYPPNAFRTLIHFYKK
jgi:SAM-dependent methyltransferase